MKVLDKIRACGIVPVVVIDDERKAEPVGKALLQGGLNCVEITFRTPQAPEALRKMKEKYPQMTVGAGTVRTVEQVQAAIRAGAEFIVSPGSHIPLIQYCIDHGICIIPGVMTPSEMEYNLDLGIETMKFFPAQSAGGVTMIQAIASPYPDVMLMPTGGIDAGNVEEYLGCKNVIACGGSWMVKRDFIRQERFEDIEQLSKQAAAIVKKYR